MRQQGVEEAQQIRTERQAEGTSATVQGMGFQSVREGQSVVVRKNSTGSEVVEPRLNLIEGSNFTITLADDPVNSEADITFGLSPNPDVATGYKVGGNQVVGTRKTGWSAATGTALRTTFNASPTLTVSNPPTQAEVEAIRDYALNVGKRFKALIDDLHQTAGHGLIGT